MVFYHKSYKVVYSTQQSYIEEVVYELVIDDLDDFSNWFMRPDELKISPHAKDFGLPSP